MREPSVLDGKPDVLCPRPLMAGYADLGALWQRCDPPQGLEACLSQEACHLDGDIGEQYLHLMDVKEGGDDQGIALEESGHLLHFAFEFFDEQGRHPEGQYLC